MEDIIKSCENCKYYVEHYFWWKYKFIRTACGHCAINPNTKKFCKTLPLKNGCEKWENEDIKYIERNNSIVNTLQDALKQINYLIQYFEADKNLPTNDN